MLNIHIIDDNQQDSSILAGMLECCGTPVQISLSQSLQTAIEMCGQKEFHCTFLDYQLSENTGEAFLHYINKNKSQGYVIVVTSHEDLQTAVDCMKLGAVDFIPKRHLSMTTLTKSLNYVQLLLQAKKDILKAETALQATESKLNQIIAQSPVVIYELDAKGNITLCRGEYANLTTHEHNQLIGKNLSETGNELPLRYGDFIEAMEKGHLNRQTSIDDLFFDVNYMPIYDEETRETRGMTVVAVDNTAFMQQNKQLQYQLEHKDIAAKLKEQFLATVSHEIRTPIHGIISLAQFLYNTELSEDQENYLRLIQKSADNLLVIVNDILDLSKLNADKMVFEEIPFSIKDTINTTISSFLPKTIEKNVELSFISDCELPDSVIGDPVRLTQILNNLVGNAVKFTEKGQISIHTRLIESNNRSAIVQIEVKDTGIGIPANKLDSIFDSFYQAGSETSRIYGGTGLGLSITKQLIHRLGGNIHVRSKLKSGTTFTVSLPYTICTDINQCNKVEKKMTEDLNSKITVLVAEDHDINRFIIAKMMKDWQMECDFAVNGREAVEFACKKSYDVILMDVEMPDMNGYQATDKIRKSKHSINQETAIIAMTGHALQGEKEKCLSVGMNEYISKPFKSDELKLKIIEKAEQSKKCNASLKKNNKENPINLNGENGKITHLNFLKEISDNNDVFYNEFIQMFLRNCPESLQDIKEGIESYDWDKIRQAAHKAKPSFNYVGMKECSLRAAKMEECARNKGQMETIKEHYTFIERQCMLAFVELSYELKSAKHPQ
jgi:signal transduction histidine kinase/CheY-like chemotaxis protein